MQQLFSYVLMYGFIAALGAAGLTFFLILFFWPQWRVNTAFVEADGLVVDEREHWGEGGKFRQVLLRYSVRGVDAENWSSEVTLGMDEGRIQQRTRAMTVGGRYRVWYDPASPEAVVVERRYWIHWMLYPIIVGSGFFLLYGVGKIVGGVRKFRGRDSNQPAQQGSLFVLAAATKTPGGATGARVQVSPGAAVRHHWTIRP
jgi:hypothetical protein